MNLKIPTFFILLLTANAAKAHERYDFYRGIRQMGMGGASVGVVDDETALILNPAALGKLRDVYVTIADPVLSVGGQDTTIAGNSTNIPNMLDIQKALDQCKLNPGARMHLMGEVFPGIVFPNFGIGVLGRLSEDAEVSKDGTKYQYDYINDYAVVVGFNFRIWDGMIKFGANARMINRSQVEQDDLDPTATNLTIDTYRQEGVGIASDVGLILTAPIDWLPSLSGVVRDVGGTAYTVRKGLLNDTASPANRTLQTVDAAFTVMPIFSNSFRSQITFEYRDILDAYLDPLPGRRYHAGVEFNWADALFIRGGYNGGYWTAGLELAIGNYQLQLTSYGEEVGDAAAAEEDRRYMGGFAIRF